VSAPVPRGPLDVLLVEDSPVDARVIENLLAESGPSQFTLTKRGTLEDALDHLARHRAGVVLLDLNLPDSDGLGTAIRVLDAAPEVPVVVFTGIDDEGVGVLAVQEGAQDYLVKGRVTAPLLRRTIQYAVQRQDLRSHLQAALDQAKAWETNLRNVLHHSRDGVVVVDADGRVCFANAPAGRLYGVEAGDLVGRPFGEPLRMDSVRTVRIDERPVEMRTAAVEWGGDPAWVVWLRGPEDPGPARA
jgi:CheY-like chemotaxis protein